MNRSELQTLGETLVAIANGAEWECQWEVDGWGAPLGRDVEYCVANRIAIRLKNPQASGMVDDGGPAFPVPGEPGFPTEVGMTLRDWFAGMALQSVVSRMNSFAKDNGVHSVAAKWSYELADAMLAARADGKEEA